MLYIKWNNILKLHLLSIQIISDSFINKILSFGRIFRDFFLKFIAYLGYYVTVYAVQVKRMLFSDV